MKLVTFAALVVVFIQAAFAQTPFLVASSSSTAATLEGHDSWVANGFMKMPEPNDPSKMITVPTASLAFLHLIETALRLSN